MKNFSPSEPLGYKGMSLKPIEERQERKTELFEVLFRELDRPEFVPAHEIENLYSKQRLDSLTSSKKLHRIDYAKSNMEKNGRTGRRQARFITKKQKQAVIKSEIAYQEDCEKIYTLGSEERARQVFEKRMLARQKKITKISKTIENVLGSMLVK